MTETRLQSGLDNIRSWYPKHDHLLARVTLVKLDFHPAVNTVTPVLKIDIGPPVLVRLRGAKLSSGQLRSLLPIYEERSIDRDLLEEGSRDLASYFQTQGYFDATSDYRAASPPNGEQLIDYYVNTGVRHKIAKVEMQGNHYFDDATIRERMSVMAATFIRYRHGRYSRPELDRDLDAIRDLYRATAFATLWSPPACWTTTTEPPPTSRSSSTSPRDHSGLSPSSRLRAFPTISAPRCC